MTPAQAGALARPQAASETYEEEADAAGGERRTYRGRDLSQILPRIRAELGADAVVTHQREGLVGGVGGFFAHRFIEVEAMAAPPPQPVFDAYDGEDADPLDGLDGVVAVDQEEPDASTAEDFARQLAAASDAPATEAYGARVASDALAAIRQSPEVRALTDELDPPTLEQRAVPAAPAIAPDPVREVIEPRPLPAPGLPSYVAQPAFATPATVSRPVPAAAAAAPMEQRRFVPPPAPMEQRRFVPPPPPVDPRRFAPPPPVTALDAPTLAVQAHNGVAGPPVMLHSANAPDGGVDSVWIAPEAQEAGEFIVARGIGARLAEELIGDARSHDLPFAGAGGIRDALHACLARRLPRHRGLPRSGALIALVGGGGSGKTSCAAALAASYRGASTLDVRAIVLGRYDSGSELSALVEPHGVPVRTAERGSRAAGDIAASRDGALIVADTPAVSPADPAGIGILGVELESLRPEEVLVTLPATSNATAARQLLAALAPLHPTGLIVTHADETDQLGAAVELSLESGLPLVFIHEGRELPGALSPADPNTIAERLLT